MSTLLLFLNSQSSFLTGNSFNDEERCVACGYDNGDVKLLDLRMNKIRCGSVKLV